ncbi:MAG: hypothetical protein M3552_10175 [Planctomycetota bacterium]|nr:hypothetical protein [Planctomycetota bacterium]
MKLLAVTLIVLLCNATVRASEISLKTRIDETPRCQYAVSQLSSSGHFVLESLAARAAELGRMPSHPEFIDLLLSTERRLSADDRRNLFFIFGRVQRPQISADDLAEILRTQRSGLRSLHAAYVVEYSAELPVDSKPSQAPPHIKCDFAFDGSKARFVRTVTRDGRLDERVLEAYDGRVLRRTLIVPGHKTNSAIMSLDSRSRFFAPGNPLLSAGLINSSMDLGEDDAESDAAAFARMTFVYETPVEVSGTGCIVVGNNNRQWYFSPEHSFAALEYHSGGVRFDQGTGRFVRSDTFSRVANSGLENISPGLWLPRTSTYELSRNGTVVEKYSTTVSSYKVNTELRSSLFTDVIPDGAYVADGVQNATYVSGRANVDERLDTITEKPPQRAAWRWLVAANVGLLSIVVLAFVVRRLWAVT